MKKKNAIKQSGQQLLSINLTRIFDRQLGLQKYYSESQLRLILRQENVIVVFTCQWKVIKEISEQLPDVSRSVLSHTFVVKPVNL